MLVNKSTAELVLCFVLVKAEISAPDGPRGGMVVVSDAGTYCGQVYELDGGYSPGLPTDSRHVCGVV